MSSFYELKNRINTVKNTGQVTKALQIVAAAKQRKSQNNLNNSRYVRNALQKIITQIRKELGHAIEKNNLPQFFIPNLESNRILMVTVMSKRGLCGPLNSKLFYKILLNKSELEKKGYDVHFISVNKMAQKFLHNFNENIIAFFSDISENPSLDDVRPIINLVKEVYPKYRAVFLCYSDFVKSGVYEQKITQLLPIDITEGDNENPNNNLHLLYSQYILEPDPVYVLDEMSNLYVDLEIYEAILSSIASENTARMISMSKATDNIQKLVYQLTLKLNKERQARITKQVAEISSNL
jgi:F-type H+-transporting ATPase subunit gamma